MKNSICGHYFYFLGIVFLVPAINPEILEINMPSIFRFSVVALGLCLNVLFARFRATYFVSVFLLLIILVLMSVPFSSSLEVSLMRFISTVLVLLYLISISAAIPCFREVLFKYGHAVSFLVFLSSVISLYLGNGFDNTGNFRGFFYNSNFLGMLIFLVCLPSTIVFLKRNLFRGKRFYILANIVLAGGLFLFLVMSHSRAAMAATLILFFTYFYLQAKSKLKYLLRLVFGLVVSLVFVFSFLGFDTASNIAGRFVNKYGNDNTISNVFYTRSVIWAARLDAISLKPLFGWGYGVNPSKTSHLLVDTGNGDTEKGNSVLGAIEEFGLVFAVPIFVLFCSLLYMQAMCKRSLSDTSKSYVHSMLVAVLFSGLFHTNFESWLFYFGNIITIFYWGLLLDFKVSSFSCRALV